VCSSDLLPHRVGLIPASSEFISAIRKWTSDHEALLVFDEVITFRMGFAGASEWYPEKPDLTALGKIIGGGFPVGAIGGRDDVMEVLSPMQSQIRFPQSGTFSANPITMTAGRIALEQFDQDAVERLNHLGERMRRGLTRAIVTCGVEACVTGAGSMFRVHLKKEVPRNYRETYMDKTNVKQIKFLVDAMYHSGFMMINTCSGVLSTVMSEKEIDRLAEAVLGGLKKMKNQSSGGC